MTHVLVTGASSFLGYHVAKRLNEQGIRPRVLELRDSQPAPLARLDVERVPGDLETAASIRAACAGVDTVLHLAFKVSVGGGKGLLDEMHRINMTGSLRLLETAAASGVRRVVVAGSALAVGVNRRPVPLDETADWNEHAFDIPYAMNRRDVEQRALAMARPGFEVVSVCPSFTLGPDDPVGAPANGLVKALINGKLFFTLPVGFGCLDVRDFAIGALLAAGSGRSGQRYLLSGENVTTAQLLEQAGRIAAVRAPRVAPPTFLLRGLATAAAIVYRLRGRPSPVAPSVLQIVHRYAWYDTTRARTELGWSARPLEQTLADTIAWLRAQTASRP